MKTKIAVGLFTVALAVTAQANLITIGETGPFEIQDNTGIGTARTLVGQAGTIQDVNVWLDIGQRGQFPMWNGDLYVYLSHGATTVVLLDRVGTGGGNTSGYNDNGFQILLDDAAAANIHTYGDHADNSAVTGTWNPDGGLLSAFNGLDASGNWTLSLFDQASGNLSQLNGWRLDITAVPDASMGGLFSYLVLFGGMLAAARRRN